MFLFLFGAVQGEGRDRSWFLLLTRVLQDSNRIGDIGAVALGEGLKFNTSLLDLNIVRVFPIVVVLF